MSHKFIPYTSLLNSIYIPFYEKPKKRTFTLEDFSIETDNDGTQSIINLNNESPRFPFINISKYDFDRKDWFFYDSNGFPYRFNYIEGQWDLEPVYGFPNVYFTTETSYVPLQFDRELNFELGVYTELADGSQLYKGLPIIVAVENDPLSDITDYTSISNKPKLNTISPDVNREFYYDFDQNRIITNQNLAGFSASDIVIAFYTTIQNISIKARLSTNEKNIADITPTVDYYIAKLSGQNLRA